jgi:membrane protein implicated in regulation of membrane protease activity
LARLGPLDYITWIGLIGLLYYIYLLVGDFGQFWGSPAVATGRISSLYRLTYFLSGGVFAIFMGSLIWLSIKFRDRGGA